ncbi:hypothetical protein FACS1894188_01640 [Clostridia bacterium]|nr:hypothetical protein FACS1894188_01640 [Clostridia bacterium]
MIQTIEKPYKVTESEMDKEFDGHWVVLELDGIGVHEDAGYVVAIGDTDEDLAQMSEDHIFSRLKRPSIAFADKNRNKAMYIVL